MIEIISEVGFCFGVKAAVDKMEEKANQGYHLFVTHPLMHNEKENDKIMLKTQASFYKQKRNPSSLDAIVFSAHGHDPVEEKEYTGYHLVDTTCPLILSRYKRLRNENPDFCKVFFGKKEHQETIGFLTHFPEFHFIDVNSDYIKAVESLPNSPTYILVPQTTASEMSRKSLLSVFKSKNKMVHSYPLCENYESRLKDSIEFLKKHDLKQSAILVVGDRKSSNANEILSGIKNAFTDIPSAIGMKVEDFPFDFTQLKNIYITSATSCSLDSVHELIEELKSSFENLP